MSECITAYSTVIFKCSQRMDKIAETKESRDTGIAKNLLSALQEVGVVTPARQQRSGGQDNDNNNAEDFREQEQHRLDTEREQKIKRKKERHSIYKDACCSILATITERDNKEDTLERLQDKFKALLKGTRLAGTDPIEIVTTLQDLLTIEQWATKILWEGEDRDCPSLKEDRDTKASDFEKLLIAKYLKVIKQSDKELYSSLKNKMTDRMGKKGFHLSSVRHLVSQLEEFDPDSDTEKPATLLGCAALGFPERSGDKVNRNDRDCWDFTRGHCARHNCKFNHNLESQLRKRSRSRSPYRSRSRSPYRDSRKQGRDEGYRKSRSRSPPHSEYKKNYSQSSHRSNHQDKRNDDRSHIRNRSRSRSRSPPRGDKQPHEKGVCFKFMDNGSCRFGDSCKFSHTPPQGYQAAEIAKGIAAYVNEFKTKNDSSRSQEQATFNDTTTKCLVSLQSMLQTMSPAKKTTEETQIPESAPGNQ